ncbi:DinB family protein, partial [Candidatus Bipolaricaulota bacterium]|nr:DinB family protein [Candidatus Bipolaricaulota bacterium]
MSWQSVLTEQVNDAYRAAEGLLRLVEDEPLEWKPATGENWMTTGQLVHHLSDACGSMSKG